MPARRIIIFGWDSGVARRSSWHLAAWGNRTWFPLSIEIYYYGNFATAPGGTRTHALRFRKPPLYPTELRALERFELYRPPPGMRHFART